jgi:methyl-accepting chemotaxis protein
MGIALLTGGIAMWFNNAAPGVGSWLLLALFLCACGGAWWLAVARLRRLQAALTAMPSAAAVESDRNALRSLCRKTRDFISDNATLVSRFTKVASAGERLSDSVRQLNATTHELAAQSSVIDAMAGNVVQHVEAAHQLASSGQQCIRDAAQAVERVAASVGHAEEEFRGVVKKSENIGSVVNIIQEIASQTNLLALNAAIEAARAGESGRGFAVVADEVRKLAERTATATVEIHAMIEAIVGSTGAVNSQLTQSRSEVGQAAQLAATAVDLIGSIQGKATEALSATQTIAQAAASQSQASNALESEANNATVLNDQLGSEVMECNRALRATVTVAEAVKDAANDNVTGLHPLERMLDAIEEIRASNVLVMNSHSAAEARASIVRARAIDAGIEVFWKDYLQLPEAQPGSIWPRYEEWRQRWRAAQEFALQEDFAKVRNYIPQQVRPAYDALKDELNPLLQAA